MFLFDALLLTRTNTLKAVSALYTEQLNKIPQGFNNNIIWNLGHMLAAQQVLCYLKSGATPLVPMAFIEKYSKGTSPKGWEKPVTLDEIAPLLEQSSAHFEEDYAAKKLLNYQAYTTAAGATLSSIDDALLYNYGHENLHYGVILTLLKLVK